MSIILVSFILTALIFICGAAFGNILSHQLMPKFQVGQTIGTIYPKQGFEKAKIMRIQGNSYYCKIMCGIAFIPIASEDNYKVLK